MAITLRQDKGSALTHNELDQNFREFYYSSSLLGTTNNPYGLVLNRNSSLNSGETIYLPTAVGSQYNIQIKSGSDNVSSSFFTSSDNFQYNFGTNHLSISGSGQVSGNFTVLGTLTATQFETVLISSSIQFASGSNAFGNSSDDTHTFTGSIEHQGSQNTTADITASKFTGIFVGALSSSAQIASDISGSFTSTSSSIASDIVSNSASLAASITTNSASLAASITTNSSSIASLTAATSSYLLNTTDTLTGNLTVTGTLTAQEFVSELVSSSVIYESGSTKFGDTADDTHQFTGSVGIQGALGITGFPDVSASLAAAVGGAGITSVVQDTTPQLGGNFDLNGSNISGSGNISIDGYISASGDIIAFASSDERLKDNVTPISDAINKINQIGGYEFDWNSDSEHSGHDVGVIAQEIEKVLPEVVAERKDGYLAVRYEKIVALLIEAVKQQQLQIDELKSKL